jgi:hypothetical protein
MSNNILFPVTELFGKVNTTSTIVFQFLFQNSIKKTTLQVCKESLLDTRKHKILAFLWKKWGKPKAEISVRRM